MLPSSDPLISGKRDGASSYQSIEGGATTANRVDETIQRTFLSQVKEAKEQSQGCCDFCMTFFGLLVGSLVWFLVLVITFTLPLVMIILGTVYFHDCAAEPMIPIFNLVAGCVILVNNITNMIYRVRAIRTITEQPKTPSVLGWITTIMNLFLLGWFIAGCYWIYGIYPESDRECKLTLYSFSFWLLNACFIFCASMIVTASMMMCLALLCF